MLERSNSAVRDIESILHPYTELNTHREKGPTVLDRASGVRVWDTTGKSYIEGLGGLWCTALGYGNAELVEAGRKQMEELSFTHLFGGKSHEPAIALAEKLKEIMPQPVSKVFFACSGSEANDTQVKLAWYYNNARGKPEKKKIISRQRGYHGVTIASASLTGLPANHKKFDLPINGILHTECPHYWRHAEAGEGEEAFSQRMVDALEAMILREGPDTVAAFIAEPIQGAGGVILPPEGYFARVAALLAKYDILFLCDEVITGFGRTGNMFAAQTFNLTPDTMSVAKALTSAYAPLSAMTIPEKMYDAMLDASREVGTFGHGYTYSGHPVSCAIALKTIEIMEREDLVGHVRRLAPQFQKRLAELGEHPLVGEARGTGLIGAIELVADKATKRSFEPTQGIAAKCVALCQEEGVLLRNLIGDTIPFCPPLIISEEEMNEMFDLTWRGLDRTLEFVANKAA